MASYEQEQKRLEKLMEAAFKDEVEEVAPEDEDEEGADHVDVNSESSDTEQEFDNEEEGSAESIGPHFIGKDKRTTWKKHYVPLNFKTRSKNIIKIKLPSVGAGLRELQDPLQIWRSFFDDEIIDLMVTHTNEYLQSVAENYERATYTRPTNKVEIEALLGLLILAGVKKCNHLNAEDLFRTNGTAPDIFRTAMSLQRFRMLIRFLRFDDIDTREERRKIDKLAPIRTVFDKFVSNCKQNYNMSHYVTVDEKLEAFRGRCPFRQYMPAKPNKYGIKIFALCDAKMFYTYNLEVYVGTQPEGPFSQDNSGMSIVQRLCEPIYGSRRNVTTDRWFTSVPLAKYLLQKELTTIGTIRSNKRELPAEFVQRNNSRPIGSSMFGFGDNCTLVSYLPKKNKNVLLISTCHDDDKIDPETGKPEIIIDYNHTKAGVDVVDQLSGNYNCARPTRRWQMAVFYSLVNIAGINTQVIHVENTKETILRRKFLENLALTLISPHLRVRVQNTNLPKTIRLRIAEICKIPLPEEEQQERRLLGRCAECGYKKNRKTKYCCRKCSKFLCLEHVGIVCNNCFDTLNNVE